ncbi:MAG: flagellar filament capping protein FliD [Proteobacteria bacterium]|nr:flagellar filament capping protein FliD [Pseudomonadota bacterium]HQR02817.1 flagellar filament capping protein FliD [Rhodocyclaceae bacterium]
MAALTSPGIGSGLDINGLVTKLMQAESAPLAKMATDEASYQAKISAFGSLTSTLATLQSAAQTLATPGTFSGLTANVSDTSVYTASTTNTASAGTYDISVNTLAKAQVLSTGRAYSMADTFKGGTLAIQIGSTNGVGGTTTNVTIADGSTLTDIQNAINGANAGVTASIINDGTTNRLVFNANTTGAAGNIRISATETGTGGTPTAPGVVQSLLDLGYTGTNTATMSQIRPPDNASFSVNGLAITRSSNTITDVINGVTLTLSKEGSSAQLAVARNTSAIQSAASAFVNAYNGAVGQIKTMTAYDATNKKGSILTGDSTVLDIQSRLSSLISTVVGGNPGSLRTLSDIGISVQKDGTLKLDSNKLSTALNDPSKDVAAFFSATTAGKVGIATQFQSALADMTSSTGIIAARTNGYRSSIQDIGKQRDAFNLRLADIEKRYRDQFNALDALVAQMNSTSTFLTQQLANLPSLSSSKQSN